MFLLVSVRHVGAHPDELQHGVSIQSSINLGETFPRISRLRITPLTQILSRVFVYLPPFISQILDFICRMVLILIFIYFEWRDTENQQFGVLDSWSHKEIVRTRRFDCIGLNKTGSVFDLTVVAWKCISLLVGLFLVFEWIFWYKLKRKYKKPNNQYREQFKLKDAFCSGFCMASPQQGFAVSLLPWGILEE